MSWIDDFEKALIEDKCPSDFCMLTCCEKGCQQCWKDALSSIIDELVKEKED
ncbi:MAG: hypothetical protein ACRDCW_02595 [Sarcina sp.]